MRDGGNGGCCNGEGSNGGGGSGAAVYIKYKEYVTIVLFH